MSAAILSYRVPRSGHPARCGHHLFLALGCAFVRLLLGSSHWQPAASLKAFGDLRPPLLEELGLVSTLRVLG